MPKPALKKAESGGSYFAAPNTSHKFIPSGCALLDCVLGGGYPLARVVNIVGDKSTGKTLLAIEACANFSQLYPKGRIWYLEAESAFDKPYAAALGFPVERVKFVSKETVEGFYNHLLKILESDSTVPGLYVLDSLDALSDDAELERDIGDGTYGAQKAKKMSELFRRLVRRLSKANICVIIISQVRDAIGVRFGSKSKRTGGRALDFYASQVMFLAQVGSIKKTVHGVQRKIGIDVRAKITKNKVGLPLRECDFGIMFGFGVDDVAANLDWLQSVGKLERVGLKKAEIGGFLRKLDAMDEEQYAAERSAIAAKVATVWSEVEQTFLPKRKKYAR